MLVLKIPEQEYFDEATGDFITMHACTLKMEHSLLSISKWETKWKKVFLSEENKTPEEFIDYIRCMTINSESVPDDVYELLDRASMTKIEKYIMDPATATVIYNYKKSRPTSSDTPTSEMIYYWMLVNNIPFECEKWRLNRLLTLIRICNIKENPQQMSKRELYAMNKALNASRREKYGSPG